MINKNKKNITNQFKKVNKKVNFRNYNDKIRKSRQIKDKTI